MYLEVAQDPHYGFHKECIMRVRRSLFFEVDPMLEFYHCTPAIGRMLLSATILNPISFSKPFVDSHVSILILNFMPRI